MNFGKTILELRKKKNVTQEEMAAELGVTAAAVSKWENNYTLPDIMMLCALADFFAVTTDELLGRMSKQGLAVIAADSKELGEKIQMLAAQFGLETAEIYGNTQEAVAAVASNDLVTHLLVAFHGSNYPHLKIHVDSKTLHLLPELCLDLDSKIFYISPDAQINPETRKIKLYISICDTDQEILNELRGALRDES